MQYKDFIITTPTSGGKAGRGWNKTSTVQVRKPDGQGGCYVKKQYRFTVGDIDSEAKAIKKAKDYIDGLA